MSTALQVTLIFAAVIGVAVTLGVAYAVTRSSARTQTEAIYEKENRALGQALQRQEAENQRLVDKYEEIAKANLVLQSTVSGAEEVRKLGAEIVAEERKRQEEHATMTILLKDVIAELRQARGAIGR